MEQLFDFLLENSYILIVVIAFFASMFKGKKTVSGMPTFGGSPDKDAGDLPVHRPQDAQKNGSKRRVHHEREEHHETHEMTSSAIGTPVAFHSEVYTEHNDRSHKLEQGDFVWDDPSNNEYSSLKGEEIGGSGEANKLISAADARQGVIWAEILGPPRAKRPFRK